MEGEVMLHCNLNRCPASPTRSSENGWPWELRTPTQHKAFAQTVPYETWPSACLAFTSTRPHSPTQSWVFVQENTMPTNPKVYIVPSYTHIAKPFSVIFHLFPLCNFYLPVSPYLLSFVIIIIFNSASPFLFSLWFLFKNLLPLS